MLAFACALSQALVVRPLLRRQPTGRQQRILAQQADDSSQRTEAEWREMLSPEAYDVLRNAGTERPWSSPLNDLKEPGVLVCTGCGSPLFRVDEKFDSGSGWPSFWARRSSARIDVQHLVFELDARGGVPAWLGILPICLQGVPRTYEQRDYF